ncbi:MAG TPA: cytochrome P450 [Mycobacteriales bacterium]|nr:cytochrome P450 [Mycobacteriales bacterium]
MALTSSIGTATEWRHPERFQPMRIPGRQRMARALDGLPWRVKPLVDPPAGSGLKPVMGSHGLPLLGHGLEYMFDGVGLSRTVYDRHGPVSWTRSLNMDMVMALGPDATQAIWVNADKAYSQRGWHEFIGPFFRRGLMLLDFDEHLLHRRIMQEAFTRSRLAAYMGRVDRHVATDLESWPRDGMMYAYPTLKRLSLDIASAIFMGSVEDDERVRRAFTDSVRATTAAIRYPIPGTRWQRGVEGRRILEEFFRTRLPAKRAADSDDLFAALCHAQTDEGETFTDDDVVNHMIFLMMAAHDTSTITTSSALAALAAHPDWQERAREESMALDGELSLDALESLSTLDPVIKEALRLVAPVPSMPRMTVKDTELLGHYIPSGTLVSLSPWFNHYMPEFWTEPERFDPERFAEPRREDKRHRYSWVPFGGGAHKCIGMYFGTNEVKILLHHLLRRFRWTTPPGYEVPWDLIALPMPADGLPLTLSAL